MVRAFLAALMLVAGVAMATPAFAHASLISAEPASGAVLEGPPEAITLRFNEPVNPVVMRLTDPGGGTEELSDFEHSGSEIVIPAPEMDDGTHILSWRVVSADGHPVAGTTVFSVGVVTGEGQVAEPSDPVLQSLIWGARLVIYLGLFVGVAGAFFSAWVAAPVQLSAGVRSTLSGLMIAGLAAVPVAFVLQGVDLRGEPLSAAFSPAVWQASFSSSYTATLIVATLALIAGLASLGLGERAKIMAAGAFLGVGVAFALSGHASSAPPQALTWLVVLVHAGAVAFWIGALLPLWSSLRNPDRAHIGVLSRFSAAAPYAIGALIVAGALLIFVQIDGPGDLLTTDYGLILTAKLAAVVVLLIIALVNRNRLTPLVKAKPEHGAPALRRSIVVELALVLVVFGLVAGWRFTPPPRVLVDAPAVAVAQPQTTRLEGETLNADVTVTPGPGGTAAVSVELLSGEMEPIEAMELAVALSNPDAGIEAISQPAMREGDRWEADGFPLPVMEGWAIELTALISDFDRRILSGGFSLGDPAGAAPGQTVAMADDGHDHVHAAAPNIDVNDPFQVAAVEPEDAPVIDMTVSEDEDGVFTLAFHLENFRISTPEDGYEYVPGVGHAHIFLDGNYIADVEATDYQLELEDGVHEIYVNLNALDHRAFVTEGALIADRVVVLQSGGRIADERQVFDVPISLDAPAETFQVRMGDTVELRLTSPQEEIIHLHGYDIETVVAPHSPVTMLFNAQFPGRFTAEAHDPDETIVFYLEVQP